MIATVLALVLQAATPPPPAEQHPPEGAMHGLIGIFDMLCARTFPDDARLDAAMGRIAGFRPLTRDEVRTYLKDDPGHGWTTTGEGGRIVVTIEAPPFHACAVRMHTGDGLIDEARWREVIAAAEARSGGGFAAMAPQGFTVGAVRSVATGDQKQNPDGSAESFYLFRTRPVDPAKAPGYGTELRLVHQYVAAGAR